MLKINKNCLLNSILCNCNLKMPTYKGHYITGKEIILFKNLTCIENNLTGITCGIKNTCSSIKNLNKYG